MKRIFIALLLLVAAGIASAQVPYALRLDQRNAANTGYLSKFVPPDSTVDCVVSLPPTSAGAVPICLKLSSNFMVSSGVIDVPLTVGPQGPQGPQGVQGIQGVAGAAGANGSNGTNGSNGKSAYEIAVANGFVGTEPQWLASLIGATGAPGVGSVVNVTAGSGLSGGSITTSGTISMPSIGTPGTYSGVTTDTQGRVTSGTARSFNYTTRALDTCFQPSTTRDVQVSYGVDILTSLTLLAGQQGTVYLRIYSDNACTTDTQEITRFVNGQTGALTVGLSLVQNVTGTLSGIIPAGAYAQLVTENNAGTPTFTARPGQEVLL
jgi:hypothetical protein